MTAVPYILKRGWRQSMRSGRWHRSRGGWTGIVSIDDGGYLVVLRRTEPTFQDALAAANEVVDIDKTPTNGEDRGPMTHTEREAALRSK